MKGILWDLDGTLLDTLEDLKDSVNFVMEKMGYPRRSREEIRSFVGNGAARLVELSLPEGAKDKKDEALSAFQAHYKENSNNKTCPYQGIPALLDRLREKGFLMGIVSNKPDYAVKALAREYFPQIPYASGEQAGVPRKPDPAGLMLAITALGGKKEDFVYIGDSEVDVVTAQNAALPCLAVTWGFRDEKILKESGPCRTAGTVAELEALLGE